MTKAKTVLFHWLVEMAAGLIVVLVGAMLIIVLPDSKQAAIDTDVYKGSAAWAVVLLGVLGMLNSVRRAIFKKKA